jgi:hypothetical protein
MRLREGAYGAGCSEYAGRGIEPRNDLVVVRRITSYEAGRKADAFDGVEGSSPDREKAKRQDATGV